MLVRDAASPRRYAIAIAAQHYWRLNLANLGHWIDQMSIAIAAQHYWRLNTPPPPLSPHWDCNSRTALLAAQCPAPRRRPRLCLIAIAAQHYWRLNHPGSGRPDSPRRIAIAAQHYWRLNAARHFPPPRTAPYCNSRTALLAAQWRGGRRHERGGAIAIAAQHYWRLNVAAIAGLFLRVRTLQ